MREDTLIQTLIVDDEPLARRKIRALLKEDKEIEVAGECGSGTEAAAAITELHPDLVFLDVQMPEMGGFEVIQSLDPERVPVIVFVTAHDQYALKAFEFRALDYILKPVDRKRFTMALDRAKSRIRNDQRDDIGRRTHELVEQIRARSEYLERLPIRSSGRVFLLKTDEIDWIEAEGKYVRVHVGKESHVLREPLGELETRVDQRKFLRIHRSAIVNLDKVAELQPWFNGEYRVVMCDGTKLMLSRTCRKRLTRVLGNRL